MIVGQQRSLEDFVDDAVVALKQSLPAALSAITAKYAEADANAGRTITLDVPRATDYYPGGSPGGFLRYPSIEVSIPDLAARNFSLGQTDADTFFNLLVVISDSHVNQEILYRRSLRYAAAIYDVLSQQGALGTADLQSFRGAWRFNPETQVVDQVQTGTAMIFAMQDAWLRP